ncbi:MAG: trypsin-like peptidase domain-containing protein [Pseudomonadota bacterium]
MSSTDTPSGGTSGGKPAIGAKAVIGYLSLGLVLATLAAWLMGALLYELAGEQVPAAGRPWMALVLGLGVGLVIPIYVGVRYSKRGRTFLRVFAGLNLVTVLVLLGLATALSGRAIDHHGAWFSELAGERSSEWQESMHALAQVLPGVPLEVISADAGSLATDAAGLSVDGGSTSQPAGPLSAQQVFARAADAVVYIGVRADPPKDSFMARFLDDMGMKEVEGHGSGFLVSPDGLIVTNHHVIGEAKSAQVRLRDGRRFDSVRVLVLDPGNDLALIQIAATGLTTVQPVASDDIAVGSPALAIGSPLGLDFTLTSGIVSAQREQQQTVFLQIQTDIAPGSSGGPVLDDHAQVIGVSTAVRGPGLNLAVAARHVRALLEQPHQPRQLESWRAAVELVGVAFEGGQADPVTRAQVQEVAGVVGKVLDGCRGDLPVAGGEVVIPLRGVKRSERTVTSSLGTAAGACMNKPLEKLGFFVAMALQSNSDLGRIVLTFQPPVSSVDGGSAPVPIRLVLDKGDGAASAPATDR